jgi:ArsR family transcriptional regulator, arsenate/arsenite/antimonite-responsive transcriptional repressor
MMIDMMAGTSTDVNIDCCRYDVGAGNAAERPVVTTEQTAVVERGERVEGVEREMCCSQVLDSPLSEQEAVDLAKVFGALADPVRLRLLGYVAAAPAGEVCACELVEPLGRAQPTVSHHLKVLYDAGLVNRQRRGAWVWYRVVPERVEALRAALAPR